MTDTAEARRALAQFPTGHFLLTAEYDNRRAGQLVAWAQPCAQEPMLVSIAARKGHTIEPLIRDSRRFAICQINPDDRLLLRAFAAMRTPESTADPFLSFETVRLTTGAPIPTRSLAALDCEVYRHLDVEADYALYIGRVLAGRVFNGRS